ASGLDAAALAWAKANGFDGEAGRVLVLPGEAGTIAGALFGTGNGDGAFAPLATGALARALPAGDWHFAAPPFEADLAVLGLLLGGYVFTRYGRKDGPSLRFAVPEGVDRPRVERIAAGVFLARDLVNT